MTGSSMMIVSAEDDTSNVRVWVAVIEAPGLPQISDAVIVTVPSGKDESMGACHALRFAAS